MKIRVMTDNPRPAGTVEKFYRWAAKHLIARAGLRAYDRGDQHALDHALAAIRVGNMSERSHRDGCQADRVLNYRPPAPRLSEKWGGNR